jgi:hypothetical protein
VNTRRIIKGKHQTALCSNNTYPSFLPHTPSTFLESPRSCQARVDSTWRSFCSRKLKFLNLCPGISTDPCLARASEYKSRLPSFRSSLPHNTTQHNPLALQTATDILASHLAVLVHSPGFRTPPESLNVLDTDLSLVNQWAAILLRAAASRFQSLNTPRFTSIAVL